MFYRAPDPVLYAQQRISEAKQRPVGRVLYATERAGASLYHSMRENIISDFSFKDLAARAVAEINPLLAAMVPEQQQLNEALHALKQGIIGSNEYLEESISIQSQQVDVLEEIKNIQQITAEKLDTLEAIAEGRHEPPKIEHKKQVAKAKGEPIAYAPRAITPVTPVSEEIGSQNNIRDDEIEVSLPKEAKDYQKQQLEQLELIRASLESLNSYLTGSEQFGLAGLVDRIFNKYTAFLNRHPAFRGIHTLLSGFAKIKLGITKPGQVKGLLTGAVKRFLGIGEEGPLQQLVGIASGQLDIQYKIYQMLKEEFKKTSEQYKLSEDTLSLFKKSPDDIIDEKIDNIISKIPFISKLDTYKSKLEHSLKEKVEKVNVKEKLETYKEQRYIPPTSTMFLNFSGLLSSIRNIRQSVPTIKGTQVNITTPIKQQTEELYIKQRENKIKPVSLKTIQETKTIIEEIKEATKSQEKVVDKIISAGDVIETKAEDIIGERFLKNIVEKTKLNKIEKITPQKIKDIRELASKKAQTTVGETGIGFTSLLAPFLPSLIHLSLGNYRLAGKEAVYMIPGIGQYLAVKNVFKLYKEYGGNIKGFPQSLRSMNIKNKLPSIRDLSFRRENIEKQQGQNILAKSPQVPLQNNMMASLALPNILTTMKLPNMQQFKAYKEDIKPKRDTKVERIEKDDKAFSYKQFKESFIGDIITRIPVVKAIEGAIEKKLSKVLWGTLGTFFPMLYAPIEAMKFSVNRVWLAIKHPMKTWNFLVKTLEKIAITTVKIPDLVFRGITTGIQKIITSPIRGGQFLAKILGLEKTHKFLKSIADGIVYLRKDIINVLPKTLSRLLIRGIKSITDKLKDFAILKAGFNMLKGGFSGISDMLSFLPSRIGKRVSMTTVPKSGMKKKGLLSGLKGFLGKGMKIGLKKLPGIGLLAGAGFGLHKLMQGDLTGAGLEMLSGAASMIPGIGTATSLAIDAYNQSRESSVEPIKKVNTQELTKTKQELEIIKESSHKQESGNKITEVVKESTNALKETANVITSNISSAINNIINNTSTQEADDLYAYKSQPILIKP